MTDAPRFTLAALATQARLFADGRRDRARLLEKAVTERKSNRPADQIAQIRNSVAPMERIADALEKLSAQRGDLPRFVVEAFEGED